MNHLCKCIYLQLSSDFFFENVLQQKYLYYITYNILNFSSRLRFFLIFLAHKSVLSCWSGRSPGGCNSNLMISQCHTVKAVISDFKCSRQMCPGELNQEMELQYWVLRLHDCLRWVQLSVTFDKMKMQRENTWTRISVIGSAYEDRNRWEKDLRDKL